MATSAHFVFGSTAFPPEPGEDAEVNPGVFGRALAAWLASELARHGYSVIGAVAEDFGRLVELETARGHLYVAVASTDETALEWRVFGIAESGLLTRLKGGEGSAEILARLSSVLRAILGGNPDIRDLREELGAEER